MSLHKVVWQEGMLLRRSTSSKAIDTTITNSRRAPRS